MKLLDNGRVIAQTIETPELDDIVVRGCTMAHIEMMVPMPDQLQLTYPEHAGFKDRTTSRQAAVAIESTGRARLLRDRVLDCFRLGEWTADEVAQQLRENILSVRPRVSELTKQQKLEPTGRRRTNRSGQKARVLRLAGGEVRGEQSS